MIFHCSADGAVASFKSQMKRADASGAAYAVIIGDREVEAGVVGVKPLRGKADVSPDQEDRQAEGPADRLTDFLIDAMVAIADAD